MTKQTMRRRLEGMARISPKSYAAKIRQRNKSLRRRLELLRPYVGKTIGDIPDAVLRRIVKVTHSGCPHCGDCNRCQWMRVYPGKGCSGAPFPCPGKDAGLTLDTLSAQKLVRVNYCMDEESITLNGWDADCLHMMDDKSVIDAAEYRRTVAFVQSHIDWANLECWGELWRAGDAAEGDTQPGVQPQQ